VLPESMYSAIGAYLRGPEQLETSTPSANDWLVVVSQTCDVVAPSKQQEAYVEILWCRPIENTRAQYRDLRSTRQLDYRPNRESHPDIVLTAHASHDRYVVPRTLLGNAAPRPDQELSGTAIRRLQAWISLRYSRPAWPDAFVNRITPVCKNRLLKALEAVERDDIAEVRVALSPNDIELNDADSYRAVIFFVVDEETWQADSSKRRVIYTAFAKFVSALAECKGIVVEELSDVVNGATFSWQQVQATDLWNFANLTFKE
jgi:hypothetical protein